MFCPQCASQNVEGAHFCRACGANISLVPQALTGQLPVAANEESSRQGRRRRREPTFDEGVRNVVMGFGFIAVAIALALFGRSIGAQVWWFWMLIPAFAMLGKGIAEIVRVNQLKTPPGPATAQINYAAPREALPSSNAGELRPPIASVTEGTTRHLGAEAATRHFDQES
jgi:hypothetical protein